ncbi:MAG: type II toxin-antitoxin system Phd/YefM family antitoxin [Acidobacteriota bacterium]|jgi:prevent-host-death family protein
MVINVYQAKTKLSQLIDRAAEGEEIVIARNGRPVARLIPCDQSRAPRKLGILAGRIHVSEDFDAPLPEEILARFEGNQ